MKDNIKPQMNTDHHEFKHGEIIKKIIHSRKSIRENPCLSVAALLSSDEELNQ